MTESASPQSTRAIRTILMAVLLSASSFLVAGTSRAADPDVSQVSIDPDPVPEDTNFAVSAIASDAGDLFGGCDVDYAEWWIDEQGDPGQGNATAMTLQFYQNCQWFAAGNGNPQAMGLPPGNWHACVRAKGPDPMRTFDEWSNTACKQFTVEVAVPDFSAPLCTYGSAAPNPASQATGFAINASATFDDSTVGNHNIVAGEYFVVPPDTFFDGNGSILNGTGHTDWDAVNPPFWGFIPFIQVTKFFDASGWSSGIYDLYMHAQDDRGNWGWATIDSPPPDAEVCHIALEVDNPNPVVTGPSMMNLAFTPNPVGLGTPTSTLTGDADDTRTGNDVVTAAEYFQSAVPCDWMTCPNGTGSAMSPSDGNFNTPLEGVTAAVPTGALPLGVYDYWVHALDDGGAWGNFANVQLTVTDDATGPDTFPCSVDPASVEEGSGLPVTLNATIDDRAHGNSSIAAAEFFDFSPSPSDYGRGIPMVPADGFFDTPIEDAKGSYDTTPLTAGAYDFYMHGRDSKGNWGPLCQATLTVTAPGPVAPDDPWIQRQGAELRITWTAPSKGTQDRFNIYRAVNDVNGFSFGMPDATVFLSSCAGGACTWTDPGTGEGTNAGAYYYIVRSSDGTTEETNTLKLGKFPQDLVKGYNDVSIGFIHQDNATATVLSSIAGSYDSVGALQFWSGCGSPASWRFWNTTGTQTLTSVNEAMGLRVRVTVNSARLITVGRVPASSAIVLCSGWNFVGYPKFTAGPLGAVLDSWGIQSSYDLVAYRDAADKRDPWKTYDPNNPANSDLTTLVTGMGFWILMNRSDVWTPPGDGSP